MTSDYQVTFFLPFYKLLISNACLEKNKETCFFSLSLFLLVILFIIVGKQGGDGILRWFA